MRILAALLALVLVPLAAAERINHAGRPLGRLPPVRTPLLFNTAQADAVLAAMQIMPVDSPWNEDISARPLLADSAAIIARIRADLGQRGTLRVFPEMNFVLVPDDQPLVPLRFTAYPDECDYHGGKSPVATWPIPPLMPVECWPLGRPAGEALTAWQRDPAAVGGDRHTIVVQPGRMRCFETWQGRLGEQGWEASNGAIFDLASNATRTPGWTSADAAGLPMFPALIRYDEVERGAIEHALRIIVKKSRRAYIWPATHFASKETEASYPAMGQRVRLQASFAIPAGWSRQSKAVAQALKTYGALVADNGGFFSVSATPDERWPEGCFRDVESLPIERFEVVQSSGAQERPQKQPRRRR
jgi:hypothetical protein